MLCRCHTSTSWGVFISAGGLPPLFPLYKGSGFLSTTSPAFFYSASPSLSLLVSLPYPRHALMFFFPPSPLFLCPPPPLNPFHPHIWNGSGACHWLHGRNQRSVQPISFRANRVTVIHEAVQLLCRLLPRHVCIFSAPTRPRTFAAHSHFTCTLYLCKWFMWSCLTESDGPFYTNGFMLLTSHTTLMHFLMECNFKQL